MALQVGQVCLHLADDFLPLGELDFEIFVLLGELFVLAVESVVGEGQLVVLLLETGLGLSEELELSVSASL